MKNYRDAFPNENIYFHNPMERGPSGKANPQKPRYKYVFIWRAMTPTGKVSKYYHFECGQKWKETNSFELPKLKKGYTWTGPYLYGEYETWADTKQEEGE